MWLDIGAKSGDKDAIKARDIIAKTMTPHSLQRQRNWPVIVFIRNIWVAKTKTLYFSKTVRIVAKEGYHPFRTRILTRVARIKEPLGF